MRTMVRRLARTQEAAVWIAVFVALAILAILGVLALLLVPRSGHAEDGPLPRDVETRLLLGESPGEIEPATPLPDEELAEPPDEQ